MLKRTSVRGYTHAKCYINESSCIITSLNLYEFSQINNNEMGVYVSRDGDVELYKDTYAEAQRIIRISDEVRISLEKIEKPKKSNSLPNTIVDEDKLTKITSSKLASKLKLKTPELIKRLMSDGYIRESGESQVLTAKGESSGGEAKNGRFGGYFIWPESFSPESKSS